MADCLATTSFLRVSLLSDAVFSGASAVLLVSAATPLAALFGLPQPLLFWCGLLFVPYAAAVGWLGSRRAVKPAAVWAIIAGNGIWAIGSIGVLLSGWHQPTSLGSAFVVGQAVMVGIFAELQFMALRHAGRASRLVAA